MVLYKYISQDFFFVRMLAVFESLSHLATFCVCIIFTYHHPLGPLPMSELETLAKAAVSDETLYVVLFDNCLSLYNRYVESRLIGSILVCIKRFRHIDFLFLPRSQEDPRCLDDRGKVALLICIVES